MFLYTTADGGLYPYRRLHTIHTIRPVNSKYRRTRFTSGSFCRVDGKNPSRFWQNELPQKATRRSNTKGANVSNQHRAHFSHLPSCSGDGTHMRFIFNPFSSTHPSECGLYFYLPSLSMPCASTKSTHYGPRRRELGVLVRGIFTTIA